MNNPGLRQEHRQMQSLTIAPQLRQSLKILQVPALELRNAILEELQSNPVLEELPLDDINLEGKSKEEEYDSSEDMNSNEEMSFDQDFDILKQLDEDWKDLYRENANHSDYTSDDAAKRQYFLDSIVSEKSLQEHIIEQAELSDCTLPERKAIEYIVGSLDDKGFLTQGIEEIAQLAKLPLETIQSALKILQSFDPIGIGSRDIQECLQLQLDNLLDENLVPKKILQECFPLLLRRRIPDIAKQLSISLEDVQNAIEIIATLDPAPGRNFSDDTNRSVTADVIVEKQGDHWTVSLNTDYIPRLRINKAYKLLITKKTVSPKEKEYIRDKIKSGRFLMSAIEQRQKTLERITWAILHFQKDFFEEGISKHHPLTMAQVGEYLGLHETTISRAIANKYVKTPYGLYKFHFFFASGFSSENGGMSNTTIKDMISKIIESEPPEKPFSDQKIVEILKAKNITIARRTIAKYREELGILPTSIRRCHV